jgi:hypothetical protein
VTDDPTLALLKDSPPARGECPECGELATLSSCSVCVDGEDAVLRANRMCLRCFIAHHEGGRCRSRTP